MLYTSIKLIVIKYDFTMSKKCEIEGRKKIMKHDFRKKLIIGIVLLFLGAGVISCMGGDIEQSTVHDNDIGGLTRATVCGCNERASYDVFGI